MKVYQTICADPPWTYKVWSREGNKRSGCQHYPTMSKEDCKSFRAQPGLPGVTNKVRRAAKSALPRRRMLCAN
jgi:hypothetical protein